MASAIPPNPFSRPVAGLSARFWAAFAGVLAVAAGLRFWDLPRAPIWMDEAFTVLASRLPVRALLFDHVDVHPPLVYLVEKLWIAVSSGDLALARAPAAMFGVLSIAVLIFCVADLVSRRAGLLAGLFLALSTGHVYFSQDARMYPMLSFAVALAAWGALGGLGRPPEAAPRSVNLSRRVYAALYVLGAVMAIYSHVVGLVFLAIINLGCLATRYLQPASVARAPYLRFWLVSNLIVLVLALPYLVQIPGSSGAFGGLGEAPITAAPWFMRNAIGFAGLPPLIRKPAELGLLLVMLFGAVTAWRAGRRGMVIVGLSVLVLYPLAVVGLSLVTPILANRIFLPTALFVAGFTGCALAAVVRVRPVGLAFATLVLGIMGLSTFVEHGARAKYENLPEALTFAGAQGLSDAPVLTCGFYTAGSTWAADPRRAVYVMRPDGVLRFDPGFMDALRMSLGKLTTAPAVEIDRFLGGRYLVAGGLAEVVRGRQGAVVIAQPCDPSYAGWMKQKLAALGYQPLASRAFRDNDGAIMLQRGETVADLYAKPAAAKLAQSRVGSRPEPSL